MDRVAALLSNQVIRTGLKAVSPEIGIGIDVLMTIIGGLKNRKLKSDALLSIIDKKLTLVLAELAKPQPFFYKRELEVRALQLLELTFEWDKAQ